MARGTILIANDSLLATRVLSSLFGREGYTVRTASGGGEALATVKREAPDLVILDVELSDMDGFELCRRIRTQPALRGVPVLALSPTADLQAKLLGYEAGVDDFVTRETSAQELLARVNVLLERRAAWASFGVNPPGGPTAGRTAIFFSLKGGAGTRAALTALRIFLELQLPQERMLVVLNAPNGPARIRLESVEQTLGVPVGAVVPYDPEFVQALNEGKPRALREERRPSRTLTALQDLARRLDDQLSAVGLRGQSAQKE